MSFQSRRQVLAAGIRAVRLGSRAAGHSGALDLRGVKGQTRGGGGLAPADSGLQPEWASFPLRHGMRSQLSRACWPLTVLQSSLEPAAMDSFSSVQFSHSVVSDSLRPHGPHSSPGLPVDHQLPELGHTHVHRSTSLQSSYVEAQPPEQLYLGQTIHSGEKTECLLYSWRGCKLVAATMENTMGGSSKN